MEQRTLGSSKIRVGEIGLGCMGMSTSYGAPEERDDATSIEVMNRAIDLGVTLFDTSDVYGPFANEQLVGRVLATRRAEVTIATKCGLVIDREQMRAVPNGVPERLQKCCDESLARLGVDEIDLWYLHRPDPNVPVEESVGAMGEMVTAGKVRALGVSEFTVEQLEAAYREFPFVAVQSELSLWTRDPVAEVMPWCRKHGVAFVPFSPLGRGFLSGRIPADTEFSEYDMRARNPRFAAEAMEANQKIVDAVKRVAARHDAEPGQIAIAWTLAQGPQVIPIPGTKRVAYLEENVGAANIKLTKADLEELDALPSTTGARY
jgi:aryl-alcohol dehydrogenase-like predicted oxidoreductase